MSIHGGTQFQLNKFLMNLLKPPVVLSLVTTTAAPFFDGGKSKSADEFSSVPNRPSFNGSCRFFVAVGLLMVAAALLLISPSES